MAKELHSIGAGHGENHSRTMAREEEEAASNGPFLSIITHITVGSLT